MKNAVFCDITPRGFARTGVSQEHIASIISSVFRLLVPANVVPSSLILDTLMMEAICFSKTSVLTTATWRHVPEDSILHSDGCENLKSYETGLVYKIRK
jgi:hypothetical protein